MLKYVDVIDKYKYIIYLTTQMFFWKASLLFIMYTENVKLRS